MKKRIVYCKGVKTVGLEKPKKKKNKKEELAELEMKICTNCDEPSCWYDRRRIATVTCPILKKKKEEVRV